MRREPKFFQISQNGDIQLGDQLREAFEALFPSRRDNYYEYIQVIPPEEGENSRHAEIFRFHSNGLIEIFDDHTRLKCGRVEPLVFNPKYNYCRKTGIITGNLDKKSGFISTMRILRNIIKGYHFDEDAELQGLYPIIVERHPTSTKIINSSARKTTLPTDAQLNFAKLFTKSFGE
jgi:hypothetical protein